ncbi:MAG: hypothetical protein CL596_05210 [Alteromonas sp.]|nr:hypothetical protein [Alteromonas sp.]|tara:strand:- start:11424 stop:12230 length:807 start_codon:yes stop_codon:yes gene_type:complete
MRTPRPIGTTNIGASINNNQDNNLLQLHIIDSYINSNFTYCNKAMSIEVFARYIGIDRQMILERITNKGKDLYQMVDPEQQGDQLRALIGITLGNALTDRSLALEQHSILASEQGGVYKPFISGEVNKALKLVMESTSGILNIAKSLGGNQGLNITLNNHNGDNNQENHNYLTAHQALELMHQQAKLEDGPSLLEDPSAKKALFEKYNIGATPIVKANEQQGLDDSREGLNFKDLAQLSDSKVDRPAKATHIDRRAREIEIDPDEDQI